MAAHYLSYWKPSTVAREQGSLLKHAASDQYASIAVGDTVWIVTAWPGGQLVLLGRISVESKTDQSEAEQRLKNDDVWRAKYHVFPAAGGAKPLREVELADVAELLRFESKRDRLEVSKGRVDAKQLQRIRRLTPETAAMLRTLWEGESVIGSMAQDLQDSSTLGAGFGESSSNREVELAAVAHVTKYFRSKSWVVTSVEAQRKGYDLFCMRKTELYKSTHHQTVG